MGVLDLQLFRLHYHLHLALFSLSLPTTTLLQEWAGEKNKTHIAADGMGQTTMAYASADSFMYI